MVFKKDGAGYKSMAHATNHTLNLSRNELDVSDKDSGEFGDTELGQISWDIQSENTVVIEDYETMLDAFLAGEVLDLVFGLKQEAQQEAPAAGWTPGTGGYEGKAVITSMTANAPAADKATYNVTFKGKGALTKRTSA